MRIALASALLLLAFVPAAAAGPLDPVRLQVCDGPCVEPVAESDGNNTYVGYEHNVGLGGGGGVYTGERGTYVGYGEGIMGCRVGYFTDPQESVVTMLVPEAGPVADHVGMRCLM